MGIRRGFPRQTWIKDAVAFLIAFSLLFLGADSSERSVSVDEPSGRLDRINFSLEGRWLFRQVGQKKWFPATVPGTVHTDLMENGIIPDPYYRDNELKVQWVERENWEYKKDFQLPESVMDKGHLELVCKGLDTLAKIFINGERIAETDNMFRCYRFDVKSFLKREKNEIRILFESPVEWEKALENKLPYRLPGGAPHVRKAPYHFGWDWGPRLVTSGIWRPLRIEAWDRAYIEDLEISQDFSGKKVVLHFKVRVISDIEQGATIKFIVSRKKKDFKKNLSVSLRKGSSIHQLSLEIPDPELWWPAGMGKQNLYTVKVFLLEGKQTLDSFSRRIGLRTLVLEKKEDKWGKCFQFVVNGVPFFAKGGNWIPADVFLTKIKRQKYEQLLKDCVAANMNMLRVWGGGVYEAPEFYDLCDELGLTIWQDFMFACAMYPGDEAFLQNVKEEAVNVVKELRHHPCLALWCGNNECEEGWFHWGWKNQLPQSVWNDYEKIFHHILPQTVAKHDPQRQYWPSSPHSEKIGEPRSEKSGDMHYWGIWHGMEPFKEYRKKFHRFFSEFGFQSFPLMETVRTFTLPQDQNITSPVMEHHQKHPLGNKLIIHYMLDHYRLPSSFESLLWLSQVLQAEGMKIGIEHFRSQMPRIMGALYWQINDCWQVASWSGIDYFGTWKALHYYAQRFYKPVLVAPIDSGKVLNVYGVSDLSQPLDALLHWAVYTYEGQAVREKEAQVRLEPGASCVLLSQNLDELKKDLPGNEVYFYCELKNESGTLSSNVFHFSELKRVFLPDPEIKREVVLEGKKAVINLESKKFAKDVYLSMPGIKGRFSDNFFDMIPEKTYTIEFLIEEDIEFNQITMNLKIISLRDTY